MVDPRYTTRPPHQQEAPAEDDAWFAQRRFGYGAGFPVRWQGWALLGGYLAALVPVKLLDEVGTGTARAGAFALFLAATATLAVIASRHTRGGWKWRWGGKD